MLLQITQFCFYESDYVTQHSGMSRMTENGAKITHKLPRYQFYTIIIWHLSQKFHFKHTMTDAAVCLSCNVYVFAILTYLITVNSA